MTQVPVGKGFQVMTHLPADHLFTKAVAGGLPLKSLP